MKETPPKKPEEIKIEVIGNLNLIKKKLNSGYAIAFLLSNKDFKIYVASSNSHDDAAKMATLSSNNSKYILIKGRISPKIKTFILNEKGKSPEDFLRGDIDQNLIEYIIPNVISALKDWLGEGFETYNVHYKNPNFDRPPESIA